MQNKTHFLVSLLLSAVLLMAMPSQLLAMDVIEELRTCARINEQTKRAACYEELGSTVLNSDIRNATTENTDKPEADSGFGKHSKKNIESYSGKIVRCQKSADSRWFFIFENDHVWKQVEADRRRFKDCDFQVTITRDTFGYKMQIEGEKGKIRVKRIR